MIKVRYISGLETTYFNKGIRCCDIFYAGLFVHFYRL